jgi:hypothetical protein
MRRTKSSITIILAFKEYPEAKANSSVPNDPMTTDDNDGGTHSTNASSSLPQRKVIHMLIVEFTHPSLIVPFVDAPITNAY